MLVTVRSKVENVETGLTAVHQVQHEQSNELAEIKTVVVKILRQLDSR
jgi:hypothetical protein